MLNMITKVIIMDRAKIKERELIISLHEKGKSTRDIANLLNISKSKAAFWILRFKKSGSLEDKLRRGRPTSLDKTKLETVYNRIRLMLIANEGRRPGIRSKEALQIIEQEGEKKYTLRHAQRILHKIGFSRVTPRSTHIRKNKKAQEEFRQEFKKNLPRSMWIIQ